MLWLEILKYWSFITFLLNMLTLTPVAQKVADKVVLRRFEGEGVEFF